MRFVLFAIFSTASVVAINAFAHDAPTGWTYPWACCSGIDCRMVSAERITQTPQGYQISPTQEIIPYNSTKIKPSPDGMYHWCSKQGKETTPTICLFVPPGTS